MFKMKNNQQKQQFCSKQLIKYQSQITFNNKLIRFDINKQMNPIASRLKSALFQQTQNLKFNLLINHNNQNRISQRQTEKKSSQLKNDNKVLQRILPSNRTLQTKQHTLQMDIQNKLNELKKRSFSDRKLTYKSSSQIVNDKNCLNHNKSKNKNKSRRRLSSFSSSKNITQNINLQLRVQKQQITAKNTKSKDLVKANKPQNYPQNTQEANKQNKQERFTLQPTTINSLMINQSTSKLRFIAPIRTQRTVMSFSIDPSASKMALQAKVFELSNNRNTQSQQILVLQNKRLTKQQKIISHNDLLSSLTSNLTLFVKDGAILTQTLDFKYFLDLIQKKKQKNLLHGQNLQSHLQHIKNFTFQYQISSSTIDSSKIFQLQNRRILSNFQILNLFSSWNKIIESLAKQKITIPGINYHYPNEMKGKHLAANKIVRFFRNVKDRRYGQNLSSLMFKVIKIQRYWRRALAVKRLRQQVLTKGQMKLDECSKLQRRFINNYQIIKTSRKTQIHIGSLSFQQFKRVTLQNKNHFQNTQLNRIFKSLQSPDTFIIYITPIQLSEPVLKYYQRLFRIATGNQMALKQKMTQKISKVCELTTLSYLLLSPKSLKRIKCLVKSISSVQNSYIIPSFPSIQYTSLSYELQIPIFSSSMTLSKLYSTKTTYRQIILPIIQKQKANAPFRLLKSVSSIFSEKQLINTLALLIYKNQQVNRWYFKIDDQFNSRGVAYFNVNSINFLKKLNQDDNEEVLGEMVQDQKQVIRLIAIQLRQKLRNRIKILHKNVYPSYQQFIVHFLTRGGVIEAAPSAPSSQIQRASISFLIQPNGDFQILGTFRKLQLNSKSVCNSVQYPASSCQKLDIEKTVRHLYRRLYLKMKLFGYFTLDLLVQKGQPQETHAPYVIGVSFYLTTHASALWMIKHLTRVRYDKNTNTFMKIQSQGNSQMQQSLHGSKVSRIQFQQQELVSIQNLSLKQYQRQHGDAQLSQDLCRNNLGVTFLYCPKILLLDVEGMQGFFKKCKFQNIAFDLKNLLGTIFLPLDQFQYENLGFLICQRGEKLMITETLKVIEFLSKNYRQNHKQINTKTKNHIPKKQFDQVGMLRGVILSEMHKSEQFKKSQKIIINKTNCQATFNNLQFF